MHVKQVFCQELITTTCPSACAFLKISFVKVVFFSTAYKLNDIKISVIGQIVKDGKIKIKKKIKIVQDNQNIEPSNDKVKSNIEFETNVPIIDIANEDESNDFSDSNPESDSDPEEYLEDSDDDFE